MTKWNILIENKHFKHLYCVGCCFLGNDQEVEFHEIKIHFFMRSKFNLFMRSNLFINIWQCRSGGQHFDHEVKIPLPFLNFNLMIVFAANKSVMRSKLKKGIIRQFQSHDQFVSCKDNHEMGEGQNYENQNVENQKVIYLRVQVILFS